MKFKPVYPSVISVKLSSSWAGLLVPGIINYFSDNYYYKGIQLKGSQVEEIDKTMSEELEHLSEES
jgi:hypothetical protein